MITVSIAITNSLFIKLIIFLWALSTKSFMNSQEFLSNDDLINIKDNSEIIKGSNSPNRALFTPGITPLWESITEVREATARNNVTNITFIEGIFDEINQAIGSVQKHFKTNPIMANAKRTIKGANRTADKKIKKVHKSLRESVKELEKAYEIIVKQENEKVKNCDEALNSAIKDTGKSSENCSENKKKFATEQSKIYEKNIKNARNKAKRLEKIVERNKSTFLRDLKRNYNRLMRSTKKQQQNFGGFINETTKIYHDLLGISVREKVEEFYSNNNSSMLDNLLRSELINYNYNLITSEVITRSNETIQAAYDEIETLKDTLFHEFEGFVNQADIECEKQFNENKSVVTSLEKECLKISLGANETIRKAYITFEHLKHEQEAETSKTIQEIITEANKISATAFNSAMAEISTIA